MVLFDFANCNSYILVRLWAIAHASHYEKGKDFFGKKEKNYRVILGTVTWCPNTFLHRTFLLSPTISVWTPQKCVVEIGVETPLAPRPLNNYSKKEAPEMSWL